jgi:N-acetylglucosamine-6-sulfatase
MRSLNVPGQARVDSIRRSARPLAGGAALLAAVLVLALGGGSQPETADAAPQWPANIVVLLTDDQEAASMRVMKIVRKEMKEKGVTMKRMYANFPLCCPSRATLLTGQYAHNHEVLANTAPEGGYGVFNELHGRNYLPIWLQEAGYRTGYIGKFLNEYAEPDQYGTTPTDVPLGWNDWRALAPSRAQYFGYQLNQNGTLRQFTEAEEDYSTDLFTTKAKRFIRHSAPSPNPFFLMLGYAAPHGGGGGEPGRSCNRGAIPAPRHLTSLRGKLDGALPPSFNEADVTDKPSPFASAAPLTPGQVSDILRKRRCAWESLLAVDESVGALLEEIQRSGEKRNTYVFFLSDNGYLRGEHRIRNQKRYLYEESARIPFIARGPGIARGENSDDVVVNADLTATILDISGATPGLLQDGQSLLPSLAQPALENARAIELEAQAGPAMNGVRTNRFLYTEWETGRLVPERELYDTLADPYQLNNLALDPDYADVVASLARQLRELRDCAGASCRTAPTGQLAVATGGNGKGGCSYAPVIARLDSPDGDEILSVNFHAGKAYLGDDTEPPFEVEVPYPILQKAAPDAVPVVARALFPDGRVLGRPANVKACRA